MTDKYYYDENGKLKETGILWRAIEKAGWYYMTQYKWYGPFNSWKEAKLKKDSHA